MKKLFACFLFASISLFATSTITVVAALGPNFGAGPSYPGFTTNVITQLRTGGAFGDIDASPTGFEPVGAISLLDILAGSPGNNWRGSEPGAFAGEFGTFLYFAVRVTDPDGFTLGNVSFNITSNDPGNLIGSNFVPPTPFSYAGCAGTYGVDFLTYAAVGDAVPIGACPGGVVQEMVYVGPAFAIPYDTSVLGDLDAALAEYAGLQGYFITGTFSVTNNASPGEFKSQGASVFVTPEPSSFFFTGLGLMALGAITRRFRR